MTLEEVIKESPERLFGAFDQLYKPLESWTGIPAEDWNAGVGIELGLSLLDMPVDYFATALGRKVIKGIMGAGALGLVVLGNLKGRAALEGLEVVGHYLNEVIDPDPETIMNLFFNLASLTEGIREQDVRKILSSFLRIGKKASESLSEIYEIPSESESPESVPELGQEIPVLESEPSGAEVVKAGQKGIVY